MAYFLPVAKIRAITSRAAFNDRRRKVRAAIFDVPNSRYLEKKTRHVLSLKIN